MFHPRKSKKKMKRKKKKIKAVVKKQKQSMKLSKTGKLTRIIMIKAGTLANYFTEQEMVLEL